MGRRVMLGGAVALARVFGLLLLAIAILALPQMRPVTGPFASTLEILSCVALASVGIGWLFGVKYFLKFFDQYLSRN